MEHEFCLFFLQHFYCEGKSDLLSPHVTRVFGVSHSRMRFHSILKLVLHCRFWRCNKEGAAQVNSLLFKCFWSLFKCSFSQNQYWPIKAIYFSNRFICLLIDKLTTEASKCNSSETNTVDFTRDIQCCLWKVLEQCNWASGACQLLLTLISRQAGRQAGRTKRPSWFNVAESDLCVCLLCKFMQNKLMLKCCVSTRDMEFQTQPIVPGLFPEPKAQSWIMQVKNANPTWAKHPGSVGNL